jgi:formate hydrogenlyase subunit 3/multisubunit Na+/H+ antiporter MnhD subunit
MSQVMAEHKEVLEEVILTRLLHLNAKVQGIATGLLAGLAIFIATNWLLLKGGDPVGPHLALLSHFFIGYQVSFVGSLIGFVYGFVWGFVVGYCVARMYNWIAGLKERRQ